MEVIEPISAKLREFSIGKSGPLLTIAAEWGPGKSGLVWITLNLENGRGYITDVDAFCNECEDEEINPEDVL
ncbi:MAG: hypothetical protein IPK68_09425 [Bdellovibrionales bacterium]|nr:hypothetical protein [Bdellovibrionales bacterium]